MLSHYDEGEQGFAYSDGTPGNSASKTFRANEDVDAGETVIGGVSSGDGGNTWTGPLFAVDVPGPWRMPASGTSSPREAD